MIQNDRFPALSRKILRLTIIGQVVIALGVIFALVILITSLTNDSNNIKVGGSVFAGIIFLLSLVIAEGFFLAAESVGVLLAIEMNTRGVPYDPTMEEMIEEEEVGEVEEEYAFEYNLQAWDSRKSEIISALKSDDSTEKEWALNELKNFSPTIKEAQKILEQTTVRN